jgi:phenylacetate-CoA ligase
MKDSEVPVCSSAPRLLSFGWSLRAGLSLNGAELQTLRLARLRQLVEHAYHNVPYYRRLFDSAGFRPRHLRRLADLAAIPVTTRERLQKIPPDDLISHAADREKLRSARTSGSTGVPLTVYRTRGEARLRQLLTLRTFRCNGLRWDDRVVTLSRRPTAARPRWFSRWRGAPLWNLCFFEQPEVIVRWLKRLKPSVIYGFATNLAIVADLMVQERVDDLRPRLLATSSDLLLPGFRRVLLQAFGTAPIDIYNCTELGDIGWQCQQRQGFHLNADWLHVEILRSGEQAAEGECGEVVVTPLYRYAMPLIRYSPGDAAVRVESKCPCGLQLPVLGKIEGRTQNIVRLPFGRLFAGFSEIMSQFPEVNRYQIVQAALDAFVVKVVPGRDYCEETSRRINEALSARLGQGINFDVREAQVQELGQPGSYRTVVPLRPVDFANG